MNRRVFIAGVGCAAVASLPSMQAAYSQQRPALPLIGVLRNSSRHDSAFRLAAFQAGLREAGFVDAINCVIDYHFADNRYDLLAAFAADLIGRRAAVLFASGNASALAAKRATTTVPVVFAVGNDPVRIGLVDALNRPGGNVTGVSFFTILIGKRLELARELTSNAGAIAYLKDANNPSAEHELAELEQSARALDQSILVETVLGEDDLQAAFASVKRQGASALIIAAGSFEFRWSRQLIALAARHALPVIYAGRELVVEGGLMSYSGSQAEAHRLAGAYCGRILKGDKPADLPVLLPTKYELVINLRTAKALGLDVPATLLARADEVIE
jgi:ABC-type uncharacterized transport system substrate-binding protein